MTLRGPAKFVQVEFMDCQRPPGQPMLPSLWTLTLARLEKLTRYDLKRMIEAVERPLALAARKARACTCRPQTQFLI